VILLESALTFVVVAELMSDSRCIADGGNGQAAFPRGADEGLKGGGDHDINPISASNNLAKARVGLKLCL